MPPSWRPGPEERLRAATVGVLNLSGLGLGYVLTRRWTAAALCWVATGILLLVALPPSPETVPVGVVIVYLLFLVLVAVHAAVRAFSRPLRWPGRTWVATVLAVVLLAVPAGGVVLYDHAQANAVQTMLLGRLKKADDLVATAQTQSFDSAIPTYHTALSGYRGLLEDHPESRAGTLVPARLAAFYRTVATPYDGGQFCQAIAPLTYLRTVPETIPARTLGPLATWPDDRLATSLLRCGTIRFGPLDASAEGIRYFNQLMTAFPASPQAAQVPAAAAATVEAKAAGLTGPDPCGTTTDLRTLADQISRLTGGSPDLQAALSKDHDTADRDVETGTFACGQDQYKKGDFANAQTTMQDFATKYANDPNSALAGKYAIAAQIAQKDADAGKQPPTPATGGSARIMIVNDSPNPVHILYTGSATGSFDVGACPSCTSYLTAQNARDNACRNGSIGYPHTSISVPPGTLYILETSNSRSTLAQPKVITEQATAGESHDYCAYETSLFGG